MHLCDILKNKSVQLINSHQQMHQNKFVTDFFIKRLPQYAFRHFYIAIIRGVMHGKYNVKFINLYVKL